MKNTFGILILLLFILLLRGCNQIEIKIKMKKLLFAVLLSTAFSANAYDSDPYRAEREAREIRNAQIDQENYQRRSLEIQQTEANIRAMEREQARQEQLRQRPY